MTTHEDGRTLPAGEGEQLSPSAGPAPGPVLVVVVTGRSGAGKSTAVDALEDLGYFCVDNLPVPVVSRTLDALVQSGEDRVAFGIDVRSGEFLDGASALLAELGQRSDLRLEVIYLDSSDELLARRFGATRRPHPLTAQGHAGARALLDGIRLERELLAPLRALATLVVDTTALNVHELRREVYRYLESAGGSREPVTRVLSFGFKHGAPQDADVVLDVRFLPNPYFVEGLRALTGLDREVERFVVDTPDARVFLDKALDLLLFCLPRYRAEGKSYVTVAIGCTGGQHRSVALTERLARELELRLGGRIDAVHRDIDRRET